MGIEISSGSKQSLAVPKASTQQSALVKFGFTASTLARLLLLLLLILLLLLLLLLCLLLLLLLLLLRVLNRTESNRLSNPLSSIIHHPLQAPSSISTTSFGRQVEHCVGNSVWSDLQGITDIQGAIVIDVKVDCKGESHKAPIFRTAIDESALQTQFQVFHGTKGKIMILYSRCNEP